jgi:hypothetical protein
VPSSMLAVPRDESAWLSNSLAAVAQLMTMSVCGTTASFDVAAAP